MKTRILLLLAIILFSIEQVMAQQTVSGTVTDATMGEPMIGVTVMEEGTSNGVVTDIDGKYSIKVGTKAKLTFTYVGYVSQTIPVAGQSQINVVMKENA